MPDNRANDYEKQVESFLEQRPGGERLILIATVPTIFTGILYGNLEYYYDGIVHDWLFVIILTSATLFLSVSIFHLRRKLCSSATLLLLGTAPPAKLQRPEGRSRRLIALWKTGASDPGELLEAVFDRQAMMLCGIIYGTILAMAPHALNVHENSIDSRWSLSLFMFSANCITGSAFYSCIMLLRQSWHFAKRLEVSLFARRSQSCIVYASLLVRVSVFGAIYIGLCQASILFSVFSGVWVYFYAFFALCVFISIYYIPQVPIRRRLKSERNNVLANIDREKDQLLSKANEPESISQLLNLYESERRILQMGLGLSPESVPIVTISAVGAALLPVIATLLIELCDKYL